MTISKDSSLVDVAFAVCTALDQSGITAVLTGGSAATYYAPEAYQSMDIDFVITFRPEDAMGRDALNTLGFTRTEDYYLHQKCIYPLEFPPGPLMVGDDHISNWSTYNLDGQILHTLTPTGGGTIKRSGISGERSLKKQHAHANHGMDPLMNYFMGKITSPV